MLKQIKLNGKTIHRYANVQRHKYGRHLITFVNKIYLQTELSQEPFRKSLGEVLLETTKNSGNLHDNKKGKQKKHILSGNNFDFFYFLFFYTGTAYMNYMFSNSFLCSVRMASKPFRAT